jgi:type IV pilus assembly protein PilV
MSRARGFSLVEVLVSLLVLAIGLLGMIALLIEGQRTQRSAAYRAAAVHLAGDMAERIRANPLAGAAYAAGPGDDQLCVNGLNDCTPEDLAADDLQRWLGDIARRLPAGADGHVAVADLDPGAQYLVTVSWPEPGQVAHATYSVVQRL